jgi:hypothetical protein
VCHRDHDISSHVLRALLLRDYVEENERIKSAVRTLKAIQEEKRRSAGAGQVE